MSACVKCQKHAELICSRCLDPYCSISCQLEDWREHKIECKPMPRLMNIRVLRELTELKGSLQSKDAGKSMATAEEPRHNVLEEQRSLGPNLVTNNSNRITQVNEMEDEKPTAAAALTPTYEELSKLISSRPGLAISNQKVPKSTSLDEEEDAENIEPKNLKLRLLKPTTVQKPIKRYDITELEVVPIREGKNVSLFVMDSSLLRKFLIAAYDYENSSTRFDMFENLKKVDEYCAVAATHMSVYNPNRHELCLALCAEDKQWYRAFVIGKSLAKQKYSVQFIDNGYVCAVGCENIMPMIEELMFPTFTSMCLIVNVDERNLSMLQRYVDRNDIIHGDVHYNVELDVYEVDLSEIKAILE